MKRKDPRDPLATPSGPPSCDSICSQMKRKDHRDAERGTAEALHNAIVEMRLLAEADEMVGTFASSYSYSASAWGH
eukprot:8226625-Pyramimonas_sp.AAC.1